jgi:hypothetical protein
MAFWKRAGRVSPPLATACKEEIFGVDRRDGGKGRRICRDGLARRSGRRDQHEDSLSRCSRTDLVENATSSSRFSEDCHSFGITTELDARTGMRPVSFKGLRGEIPRGTNLLDILLDPSKGLLLIDCTKQVVSRSNRDRECQTPTV